MSGDAKDGEVGRLAERLACMTEAQVAALADVKPSTLEAWRKRGKGPSYIIFGNRYLYPVEELQRHLSRIVRDRGIQPSSLL